MHKRTKKEQELYDKLLSFVKQNDLAGIIDLLQSTSQGTIIIPQENIESPNELIRITEENRVGARALIEAARIGQLEMGKALLDFNVYVQAQDDDEWTSLHWAANNCSTEVVTLLLDSGADIEAKDNNGNTALHLAANNCSTEVVTLLLDSGADIEAKDNDGYKVIHLATSRGRKAIANFIKEKAIKRVDVLLEHAILISLEESKDKGEIGLTEIPGFRMENVESDGNCFYHAIINQMIINSHTFINSVVDGTAHHDSLRLRVQGQEFSDREWADDRTFDRFITEFPDVILAVIDTRMPEEGFTLYYRDDANELITHTGEDNNLVIPAGRTIIRLAATGNHFMSILGHPALANGAIINQEWSVSNNQAISITTQTVVEESEANINQEAEEQAQNSQTQSTNKRPDQGTQYIPNNNSFPYRLDNFNNVSNDINKIETGLFVESISLVGENQATLVSSFTLDCKHLNEI